MFLFFQNTHILINTTHLIEIFREIPGARIPGGSEDVMLDLAIRQLVKNFRTKTAELEISRARAVKL